MGVVPSTLHKSIKFFCNNQLVTVKADPNVMHLFEMEIVHQVSVVPTLIPSVSSNVLMFTPAVPTMKDTLEIDVPKEDPSKARNLNSTPTSSQKNACLGDDWGSLDFIDSFSGEHKVNPIHLSLSITSSIPAIKDDYSFISWDNVSNSCNILNVDPPLFEEDDHTSIKEVNVGSHVKKDDGNPIEECNPHCWNNALYGDPPPLSSIFVPFCGQYSFSP